MGFGLKMRGLDRGEIRRRVEDAARILGLTEVRTSGPALSAASASASRWAGQSFASRRRS